ncbi:RICIN domain-containing protein [Streptomyces brevispora]|uniref:RICIN domain-containing protein n=1 Tax=Streptomyces brevispora TaxID=887462 RepID=UPI0038168856
MSVVRGGLEGMMNPPVVLADTAAYAVEEASQVAVAYYATGESVLDDDAYDRPALGWSARAGEENGMPDRTPTSGHTGVLAWGRALPCVEKVSIHAAQWPIEGNRIECDTCRVKAAVVLPAVTDLRRRPPSPLRASGCANSIKTPVSWLTVWHACRAPVVLSASIRRNVTVARNRQRASVAAAAAAVIGGLFFFAPVSQAQAATGSFLYNLNSGKCLSPAGGAGANNTGTVIFNCDTDPSRLWYAVYKGNNNYQILNLNSGKCLSPAGGAGANNTATVIYTCDNDSSRLWYFSGNLLVNYSSGKCLTPAGGGVLNNTATVIYNCDTHPSRTWQLTS